MALNKLTADNVTGAPLPGYEANRAYLQPAGAEALARVQRRLAGRHLGEWWHFYYYVTGATLIDEPIR